MDWIAFDADDTLWSNEETYLAGREVLNQILAEYQVEIVDQEAMDGLEVDNIGYYGYGAMSFVLSLIEMAIKVTEGKIQARHIQRLIEHGKHMLSGEVEVFEGVENLLQNLSQNHKLMLITKGDLFHQQRKIETSGLAGYFKAIEVVSDKSRDVYREILDKYQISPESFCMIGNSLRSDILPVLELGCWALHLSGHLSWSFEDGPEDQLSRERFLKANHITGVVETLVGAGLHPG